MDKPAANDEIDQITWQSEKIENQCQPLEDALQESEETFRIDLLAKDGRIIPCETSAAMISFNGRPADLVVIRNISERVLAEKALQASEATFSRF